MWASKKALGVVVSSCQFPNPEIFEVCLEGSFRRSSSERPVLGTERLLSKRVCPQTKEAGGTRCAVSGTQVSVLSLFREQRKEYEKDSMTLLPRPMESCSSAVHGQMN